MKINFEKISHIKDIKSPVLVRILTEENLAKINTDSSCPLGKITKSFKFKAKEGEFSVSSAPQDSNLTFTIFIGAGSKKDFFNNEKKLIDAGSAIVDILTLHKITQAHILCDGQINSQGVIDTAAEKEEKITYIAQGVMLKGYSFNKYFTGEKLEKNSIGPKKISFIVNDQKKIEKSFTNLKIETDNVFFARNLVTMPANELNPDTYPKIIKKELESLDNVKIELLDEEQMKKMGMNTLVGVGMASDKKSKLVIMQYNGDKKEKDPLLLVGKGVTFDSGGLSLKPAQAMEDMKTDMGGSAVVTATIKTLAQRKAKVNAIGVIGLVENVVSGNAQKPGDVVKSLSGQTVEILNTDAEGRLVLADALYYAIDRFNPKMVIDLATLTGAVVVVLSDLMAGVFTLNDILAKEIKEAADKTGENVWRLPLSKIDEGYDKMIDSDIADVRNISTGRGGGATTAAQFLQRFTKNHPKWAHIDIAGVTFKGKGDSFAKKGATGFGVRLLNRLIQDYYEN